LGLLGVWFRQADDYVAFSDGLAALKRAIFGPEKGSFIVLHRSDVIGRKGPFGVLQRLEVRQAFDDALIDLVRRSRFRMICVTIDKLEHSERYSSPFHPYHYCLAAMLDRFSGWLNYKNAVGDVMAESRGKEEDSQLQDAYLRVYNSGTVLLGREHHQRALTSKEIKIRSKMINEPGLQLADILAHPAKHAFLAERGRIGPVGEIFGRRLMAVAEDKYNRKETTGEVAGYGKVWL
jgi:hypothetical protein